MKKIAIVGAGEFQTPLIERAKQLNFETHVFAWQCGDVGEKAADFFYPISIVEKEKILCECERIGVDAMATIASDLATLTVGYVARHMGLPHNSKACILCSTNKFQMRQKFRAAKIKTPAFFLIKDEEDLSKLKSVSYPAIVKPTDRSGSRGITKVSNEKQGFDAVKKAMDCSFAKEAIVEEYIEGEEYSCECISQNATHHFLAFTKKYTTGAPHFIETGHMQPCGLEDQKQKKMIDAVKKGLDALSITTGASHTEFRISKEGEPVIIEIGARMGGDCIGSHLVPLTTGYDYLRMVIEAAAGIPLTMKRWEHQNAAATQFLFTQEDVRRLEALEKHTPHIIVEKSQFKKENLCKAADSSTRAGYYIMAGQDRALLERVLESR